MSNDAISLELKSELKFWNLAFLDAIDTLNKGERVSGSDIRGLWTNFNAVLKKVPREFVKSLDDTITKPDLEDSKNMFQAVIRQRSLNDNQL